jgi:alkanesulfonate monooxygenase SsuD/methylene tetrahydromethanopterin reductase-like flavin-dependent oxidoreductase (luciferase family)
VKFGVFDHLDRAGGPDTDIGQQYADRLALTELYDRAGLYAYHVAEHHGTPLGMAPSPGLFLAAVAQRTTRLRFGPLVSVLGLQHPLRILEEMCMLDQLSGGRLELGIGRGASPIELGFFDVTPDDAAEIYREAVEILLAGADSGRISADGPRFVLRGVPVHLTPVQRPHPPLWYAAARPESARWAAERGINIVVGGATPSDIRRLTDAYRAAWSRAGQTSTLPLLGMSRHVVIADTDAEARDAARPAYELWYDHLTLLWRENDVPFPLPFPESFEAAAAAGLFLVGSAPTVRDAALRETAETGVNYVLCRLAFGDLPLEVSKRSVALLADEVMPAFSEYEGVA